LNAGHKVVVVDNLSTGKEENLNPDAKFYHEDIRSTEVFEIMRNEKVDVLNHHAAQMSVPASVEDPLFDADVNIRGFINLLESAVNNNVKKCIFISSGGAIYGEATEYPTSENYKPQPLSPYAISKFTSEYYLNYYRHQYGLDFTILRYANIYGPRQIPHGEAGVVAIFMSRLIKKEKSTIFHFPDEVDGMIRDYCYVGDVVKANISALSRGSADFFNIGTGVETRTQELYTTIYEAVRSIHPDIPGELGNPSKERARDGDIPRSCLVVKKALKFLGWKAETELIDGIQRTLQWHLERSH
jgi:UDP-glucose 4-epimerase